MKYVAHCCVCLANFETHYEMRAHIEVCEKHPLAAALASNAALSSALRNAVAASAMGFSLDVESFEAVLAAHGVVPVKP